MELAIIKSLAEGGTSRNSEGCPPARIQLGATIQLQSKDGIAMETVLKQHFPPMSGDTS